MIFFPHGVLLNLKQQFKVVEGQLVISLESGSALLRCTVQKHKSDLVSGTVMNKWIDA